MKSKTASYRIAKAHRSDLTALAEVQSKSMNAAYPAVIPSDTFDSNLITPEKLEVEINSLYEQLGPRGGVLKAEVLHRMVGICVYGEDTHLNQPGVGYIQRVFVHPEFWRIGIGEALINRAMKLLRGHGFKKAALHLLERNLVAKSFYEKRGWKYEYVFRVLPIGTEIRYSKPL